MASLDVAKAKARLDVLVAAFTVCWFGHSSCHLMQIWQCTALPTTHYTVHHGYLALLLPHLFNVRQYVHSVCAATAWLVTVRPYADVRTVCTAMRCDECSSIVMQGH